MCQDVFIWLGQQFLRQDVVTAFELVTKSRLSNANDDKVLSELNKLSDKQFREMMFLLN